ncbi:MAG: glycosyltransferase family 1 protein [Saprospiraceae bacterium]|nr:glycosyltransferase family 1 protein [Saprospiraceae bacterium]
MKIALNARHMLTDRLEGVGIVTDEVMSRIVHSHPEDQFDYYFDRKFDQRFVHSPNVIPHTIHPVTRLPILIRYWLDHPVRKHVVKQKANVFFSPDGFIPLGMSIPKVSMVHDVAYLRYPEHLQPRIRAFYKKWMPRYLAYTDHIITVSEFSKSEIIAGYNIPADKISVVYNGITAAYKPVSEEQKKITRDRYTNGRPYFVYLGAIHPRKNILTLVKSFEQFKSSYPSDHQLVLAGRASWHTEEVFKSIAQSQWKDAFHLPGYIATADATTLVASAEAMIYPSLYEGFGLPLVEAMACGVPVICSNVSSLPEVASDAALLFDPHDVEQLAHHMTSLAKEDSLRHELIALGNERSKYFSWDKAALTVYEILSRFAKR